MFQSFFAFVSTIALFLALESSAHPGVQQASQKVMVEDNDLATDLEALREAFHIPGMAVGILHKDETVLLQGFGHSNEKGSRVDETTRFMLASLTKAFTSFAVGTMVSEGSLSWTAPIRRYRDVRFHDPVTTEKATLLDIMSHRTGLGTGYDAVRTWRNSSMALLEHLEALKPTKQFREEWQYSNLMFHLAGVIAGNASSQGTWEGLVQERILDPLDMSRTTVDFDVSRTGNAADGYYVYANGSRVEIPFEANRRSARTAPAGVIGSSAEDMVKWLRALLKKGIDATGKRMLDQTDFDMLHTPRMVMPGLPRFQEMGSSTYGLGWAISQYRGHRIVSHSGGWAGFTSYLVLFPDQELGAVILTNANNAGPAVLAACNTIADRILFPSAPPVPWVDRLLDIQDRMRKGAQAEYDARQAQRIPDTNPSRPLSAYAGTYTHDALGLVTVEIKGDQLAINSPMIGVWHATHWHYDSFNFQRIAPTYIPYEFDALLSDDGGREMLITFGVDPLTGKIAGLSNMDLERGLKEGVWFERIEQ
ncbi:hypothetical protein HKX48_004606 [Thoreauomyces humboldtii]|nr:hypothetical protein HKX48_004606 [Thoreauomyces humboldtii]